MTNYIDQIEDYITNERKKEYHYKQQTTKIFKKRKVMVKNISFIDQQQFASITISIINGGLHSCLTRATIDA